MSLLAATAPSWPTFAGALLVSIGAFVLVLGPLLGDERLSKEQIMAFGGNCVVGIGAAVVFTGAARGSTSGEVAAIPWALIVFAAILFGVVYWRRRPSTPAKGGPHDGAKECCCCCGEKNDPESRFSVDVVTSQVDVPESAAKPYDPCHGVEGAAFPAHDVPD
ncbi:MAG: hypothetical protein WBV77_09020 [Solirubrobacteraceae bacterium]